MTVSLRKSREETQTMVPEKLGPKPRPPQTLFFSMERRNSDHGMGFWGGKTQTMVWVDEGALKAHIQIRFLGW